MTGLPDITGLSGIVAADWHALRERLGSIGVNTAAMVPFLGLATRFAEDEREPIRIWHLRRRTDPAALAMRLLMCGDVVTVAESIDALGDRLHGLLRDAGLLRESDGQVRCVLRMAVVEDFCVFADDLAPGGDVVMGMRETTLPLWRATTSSNPPPRALDLGCGAGVIGLLLSRRGTQVVATDNNPRAAALARINVALNGVDNVMVREGDLFDPVAGETFDLIAAHPPYVALTGGVPAISHMHGGPRGDEIACRMIATLAPHLAPGGHAVVQAHWPLRAGETTAGRIREVAASALDLVAAPALDVLVLRLGLTDADDLATFWGQRGGTSVAAVRDHYAEFGLVAAESSLAVLRRGTASGAWTAALEVAPASTGSVTGDVIVRLLRFCDLLHGTDADLAAARLRLPLGTSIATVDSATGKRTMLMVPPATLRGPITIAPDALAIVVAVNGAPSVGESGQPLAAVRRMLAAGALEPQ